jgi:hypothetical protein
MPYKINLIVRKVEKKSENTRCRKTGVDENGKPVFTTEVTELGWCVLFNGSDEWVFIGYEKPDINVGDKFELKGPIRE